MTYYPEWCEWPLQLGRIRREAYMLHIGNEQRDIDELRNHFVHDMLDKMIEKLDPPITAEEVLWLVTYFGMQQDWYGLEMAKMLLKHCQKNKLDQQVQTD